MIKEFFFLSSPYRDKTIEHGERNFLAVIEKTSQIIKAGINCFCPLIHSYHLSFFTGLPNDMEFWSKFDDPYLRICTKLCILTVPRYEKSAGVKVHINAAIVLGLPILFLDPKSIDDKETLSGVIYVQRNGKVISRGKNNLLDGTSAALLAGVAGSFDPFHKD